MFFTHYVCNFSQTWSFLLKYHRSTTPEHLTLSLDAVSLMFTAHNTGSASVKDLSRKKYTSALRKISTELQCAESAKKMSTFEGALLLDLFEKMSKSIVEGTTPRHVHVEGALALVKLRGIETFREGPHLRPLLGLALNATICCLAEGRMPPKEINIIRAYAAKFVDTTELKWKLGVAILEITNLIAEVRANTLTFEEHAERCAMLDASLETMAYEAGLRYPYKPVFIPLEHTGGLLPEDLPPFYDIYPNRTIMQAWNILRSIRILLYEELTSYGLTPSYTVNCSPPPAFITRMIQQICASAPHITNCSLTASGRISLDAPCQRTLLSQKNKQHTVQHVLDAYILIFPFYVAAWSRYVSTPTREWILEQLRHIADHFGLAEANVVRNILQREAGTKDEKELWYVSYSSWSVVPNLCPFHLWLAPKIGVLA